MYLFLFLIVWVQSESLSLGTIIVEAKAETEIIKDVRGEDIKSADLAEALYRQSGSVSLSRRSGIANDIVIRGQRKDNINVSIDGMKIHGACPNRMDPPISHILTNNVDYIEINEGPFNVEDFAVLSADVKIYTLKPKKKFSTIFDLGFGSFGYKKAAIAITGGSEKVRFLFSASSELSKPYKDGNGDDFVGQIAREVNKGTLLKKFQYQAEHYNKLAYKKETMMAKIFWDISENQAVNLSYTMNASEAVLYPTSPMDALSDDSYMFNLQYSLKNLARYSKNLNFQIYETKVDHPMSTRYRKFGKEYSLTHALMSKMQGVKIKNSFGLKNHALDIGFDYSLRQWDGGYFNNDKPFPIERFYSIEDVRSKNMAFFIKDRIALGKLAIDLGLRNDITRIETTKQTVLPEDLDGLNGYILAKYARDSNSKYFLGLGKSSRIPDAKELYFVGSKGNHVGTPTLKPTQNYEVDIGFEEQFENSRLKVKVFYSELKDYIAYNANNKGVNAYENIDATLYGAEVSGSYFATESLSFDWGVSYQRGTKKQALQGQEGTNLPDISPFKSTFALQYAYAENYYFKAEVQAASSWSEFDAENGEQKLDAYGILNLKISKQFNNHIEWTLGMNNVFNTSYAISNTYQDLVFLPTFEQNNVILMNEPGRYVFVNMKYTL